MLRKEEKAQASILTIVLIILIIFVAIGIIWGVIYNIIRDKSADIDVAGFSLGADIKSFELLDNFTAKVTIERSSGGGAITAVKFIFEDYSGNTYYYLNDTSTPETLGTRTYVVSNNSLEQKISDFSDIKKVSVYYIYKNNQQQEVISHPLDSRSFGGGGGGGGTSCPGNVPHSSFACAPEDVYWFNECGTKTDLKQNCSNNNETCLVDSCVTQCKNSNDLGCSSEGVNFCDSNLPYNCVFNGSDGCYDRVNLSSCGIEEACVEGIGCSEILECTSNANCTDSLSAKSLCTNNPDNNPFTLDSAPANNSVCNLLTNKCTIPVQIFTHACSNSSCGAECDSTHLCGEKCIGDVQYYNGNCNSTTCACIYTAYDCNDQNGWYFNGNIQWVDDGECSEKQQEEKDYFDYTCVPGGCGNYVVTDTQWFDNGSTRMKSEGEICTSGIGVCDAIGVCVECIEDNDCNSGYVCNLGTNVCEEEVVGDCDSVVSSRTALLAEISTNAQPGDVICLNSADYGDISFSSTLKKGTGWLDNQKITYRAVEGETPVFTSLSFSNSATGYYISLEGINVDYSGSWAALELTGTVKNIKLNNMIIEGKDYTTSDVYSSLTDRGISFTEGGNFQDILIEGSEVKSVGWGIKVGHNGAGTLGNNIIIRNNSVHYIAQSAIALWGATGNPQIIIEENNIYDQVQVWVSTDYSHGSGISIRNDNLVIRNNIIHGYGSTSGIRTYQDIFPTNGYSNILLENNLVYDTINPYPVQFIDIGDNFVIKNNTFVGWKLGLTGGYQYEYGLYTNVATNNDYSDFTLKNNLIVGSLEINNIAKNFASADVLDNIIYSYCVSPVYAGNCANWEATLTGNKIIYQDDGQTPNYFEGLNFFTGGSNPSLFTTWNYIHPGASTSPYNSGTSHGYNLDEGFHPNMTTAACPGNNNELGLSTGEYVGALTCEGEIVPECTILTVNSDCDNRECNTKSCVSGICVYTPSNEGGVCTSDSNVCTNDVCFSGSCVHNFNTAPCDDGLFCNGNDVCSLGTCAHAGDPCGVDETCNEGTDNCDEIQVPAQGLINWWKFDETSGTIANDEEGLDDGAISSVGFVDDVERGRVFGFNGASSKVDFGDASGIESSRDEFTLSMWVKGNTWANNNGRNMLLAKYNADTNQRGFYLSAEDGKIRLNVQESLSSYDSTTLVNGATTLSTNTWYHIVGVFDSNNFLKVYVNGNLDGTNTANVPTDFENGIENLYAGVGYAGAQLFFDGYIDDVQIYNKALNSTEILNLYTSQIPVCEPDCTGRECGGDGCGGSCSPGCSGGETCNEGTGQCVAPCVPNCDGLECGLDPICGESCGGCGTGEICNAGICEASNQDCDYYISSSSELNNMKASTSSLLPGQVVCLNSGNYGDIIFSSSNKKGTSSNWVTYRASDGASVNLTYLSFENANFYTTFKGVNVKGDSDYDQCIGVLSAGHVNILDSKAYCEPGAFGNCPTAQKIHVWNSNNILIENCETYYGLWGIQLDNVINGVVRGCEIHDVMGSGIRTTESGGNYLLENNIIYHERYEWSQQYRPSDPPHGSGFSLHGSDTIIRNNTVYDFGSSRPIYFYPQEVYQGSRGYHNMLIENNLFYDYFDYQPYTGTTQIQYPGFDNSGDNVTIRNNTFDGEIFIGFSSEADGFGLNLYNNIIKGDLVMSKQAVWKNIDEGYNLVKRIRDDNWNLYTSIKSGSTTVNGLTSDYINNLYTSQATYNFVPKLSGDLCNHHFLWADSGIAAAGALPCPGQGGLSSLNLFEKLINWFRTHF